MPSVSVTVLLPLLLLTSWGSTEAGKLLVVPQDASHWLTVREVSEALGQKGHQIVVLVPEFTLLIRPSQHYTLKTYPVPYTPEKIDLRMKFFNTHNFDELSRLEKILTGTFEYQIVVYVTSLLFDGCESLLQNESMVRSLEEDHFDALLTDPALPCGVILAERLKLPAVHLFRGYPCGLEHMVSHSPSPASYVPRCYSLSSDHMSFGERSWNFIGSFLEHLVLWKFYRQYEQLATTVLQREVNIMDLFGRASIWLLRYDFVFEYPRPVMPNMVFVGGINCVNEKKLNEIKKLKHLSKPFVQVEQWTNPQRFHPTLIQIPIPQ